MDQNPKAACGERGRKERAAVILFAAVLLLQLLALVCFGAQKQEYHIDEIYTYILSNGHDYDRISNRPDIWDCWVRGSDLSSFVTVEEGERFAYDRVYYNNSLDAHPPLYYFFFHTLCSFFPNVFSKWLGLGLNILFFALSQIALFFLSKKIFGANCWAVAPTALLGATRIGLDSAFFMRMYALMTLLTVLLMLIHYAMLEREKRSDLPLCFAVTFLGMFTHYYFAIPAFFMAAFYCFRLLRQKRWKRLIGYAASMLGGVILVFLVYPAGLQQVTGSPTNNVGNEVFWNMFNFRNTLRSIGYIGWQALGGIFSSITHAPLLTLLAAAATVALAFRKKGAEEDGFRPDGRLLGLGTALLLLSFLLISHISNNFTFVRYVYSLVPLLALILVYLLRWIVCRTRLNKTVLAVGLICVCLISTGGLVAAQDSEYLLAEYAETNDRAIELAQDRPSVLICRWKETFYPTANFVALSSASDLYMNSDDDPAAVAAALEQKDCSDGVVFFLLTDKVWTDGVDPTETMDAVLAQSDSLSEYEKIGDCVYGMIYLAR